MAETTKTVTVRVSTDTYIWLLNRAEKAGHSIADELRKSIVEARQTDGHETRLMAMEERLKEYVDRKHRQLVLVIEWAAALGPDAERAEKLWKAIKSGAGLPRRPTQEGEPQC